jgi:protein-tyrosine phosphatase
MIDLHNHILPGLDDGSRGWHDSLEMARAALDDGITDVVCTPHWVPCEYENESARILDRMAELQRLLKEKKLPLRVYPGAELRVDPCLPAMLRDGKILTINNNRRYALIELPMQVMPMGMPMFFFELGACGVVPVIAHPERYPWVIADPSVVYQWVNDGFLIQLTAASLLGHFGRTLEKLSRDLLEHNLVHLIATDSHGLKLRSPKLSRARQAAAGIVGEEASWELVRDNPRAVIDGKPLATPEPIPFGKRSSSMWQRLLPFGRKKAGGGRR